MSKWVIENIELIRKTYVVEAYGKPSAILTAKAQAPITVETISEIPFNVTSINEYEYDKNWKPLDPDIGPDQLKDNLDWIDKASGRDREGNGK